jgi:hypothetical protein
MTWTYARLKTCLRKLPFFCFIIINAGECDMVQLHSSFGGHHCWTRMIFYWLVAFVQDGWYGTIIYLGDQDGLPILSFTYISFSLCQCCL